MYSIFTLLTTTKVNMSDLKVLVYISTFALVGIFVLQLLNYYKGNAMSILRKLLKQAREDNPASGLSEESQNEILKQGGDLVKQVHNMVEQELIIVPVKEKIRKLSDDVIETEPEKNSD